MSRSFTSEKKLRAKANADEPRVMTKARMVTLTCGCRTAKLPPLSNPDRWWCERHTAWLRKRRNV